MSRVTELGYMGLTVSDVDAWRDFVGTIVGMQVVEGDPDGVTYVRMDGWHHRIALHPGNDDDLAYLGWRVPGPPDLEAFAENLDDRGVAYRVASDEEARERRVLGLLKLHDPGGIPTEIFYGPQIESGDPFHPGRPMFGRFVTGSQGFGHLVLREQDTSAATDFYRMLGLEGASEYKLNLPGGQVAQPVFMHCNERHHSVGFGLGPMEKRINHLMIEYTHLDDLGLAHDAVRARKIDVALQLGKHANDQALTFYCANPSGWLWELGWGSRPAPSQQEYYVRDIFGHGNEATGYGLDIPLT